MDIQKRGAKKKRDGSARKTITQYSKRSARQSGSRKRQSRSSRRIILPKTMRLPSKKSNGQERGRFSRANTNMNMTELQFLAKSRGIPFGGLTKTKLIRKINNYY